LKAYYESGGPQALRLKGSSMKECTPVSTSIPPEDVEASTPSPPAPDTAIDRSKLIEKEIQELQSVEHKLTIYTGQLAIYTRWLAIATIGMLFVTFFAVILNGFQLLVTYDSVQDTHIAVDAAKSQATTASKALAENEMQLRASILVTMSGFDDQFSGKTPTSVQIRNVGLTAAINVTQQEIGTFFTPPIDKFFVPKFMVSNNLSPMPDVARDAPIKVPVPIDRPVASDDIESFKRGSLLYITIGRIRYDDLSGNGHHTNFCYILNPALFDLCPFYNDRD
jgi:hypothetical protein